MTRHDELLRRKYQEDIKDNMRFACQRYHDDTCPYYDDICDCPRNDTLPIEGQSLEDRDKSRDKCRHFLIVGEKLWRETMCWTLEELEEIYE